MAEDLNNPADKTDLDMLKHDIKNQLSNIQLALEGLRYEVEGIHGDFEIYLESLAQSALKIDKLLDGFK
ncbi:hypothetical protein [Mucilaginibacter sp. AK015]|uniref:hypothetical protein n=1 Tax=Mucilaginibacter sp. AK015 TaxID=2723072 RepID=UPI0016148EA8|nr:hypothetical protein [Mucilaginibacter sp. AK015]MBB5396985.1 hypothetical protein [Mucilaginibacter sp. AK015]